MDTEKRVIAEALQAMADVANALKIRGVAVVLIERAFFSWSPGMRLVSIYEEMPQIAFDPNDPGANHIALAWSMVGEMISTSNDSGSNVRMLIGGEQGQKGGVYEQRESTRFYAAFSGGNQDLAVRVARAGMQVLLAA